MQNFETILQQIKNKISEIEEYSDEEVELMIAEIRRGLSLGYGSSWALAMPNDKQITDRWKKNISLYNKTVEVYQTLPLEQLRDAYYAERKSCVAY